MPGKHCKLYDENLVRHIMISTGISLLEYLQRKKEIAVDDICEFVERNADHIIENTIEDMNSAGAPPGDFDEDEPEAWKDDEIK